MRRWLPSLAVGRPVTCGMLFLSMLLLGWIAWSKIPLQMMPAGFDYPMLWVSVPNPGGTPLETESEVIMPVEEQLATLTGIKSLTSKADEGGASFSLTFYGNADLDEAYNGVVDRLDRATADMPDSVRDYMVYRFNPADQPILWAGVSIEKDPTEAHAWLDEEVRRRLERVPGVARVDFWGLAQKQASIDLRRDAVVSQGVNLSELLGRLSGDNFQMASGQLTDQGQRVYLRSLARLEGVEELRQYPVREGLELEDISEVFQAMALPAGIQQIDGQSSVGLGVYKTSSANTVEICREVHAALEEINRDAVKRGVSFHAFGDQGELIEDSVDTLKETALQGGGFAVLVLLLFLRDLRLTLMVATCIPLSLLLCVTALYFGGGSLNLLSLMGLMIAVGMVVDNAIVVVETIHARRREGDSPREAAIAGAAEVNLAILLSTLTTMVVFLPLILMGEDAMFSFFMQALGLPVVFALAASLVVALIFVPLGSLLLPPPEEKGDARWLASLTRRYEQSIRWVLRRRFDTFLGGTALLILTVMVAGSGVSMTDQAEGNLSDFAITFRLEGDFSASQRESLVQQLQESLDPYREEWEVRVTRTNLDDDSTRGTHQIYLQEGVTPDRRKEILDQAEAALPELPGVRWSMGWSSSRGDSTTQVRVVLQGQNSRVLETLADDVIYRLQSVPGVISAQTELDLEGQPELHISLHEGMQQRYGVDAQTVGRTLSFAMRGTGLPGLREETGEVPLGARFDARDRSSMETLMDFEVWSPTLNLGVPLSAVSKVEKERGYQSIYRKDRRTSLDLQIEMEPGVELYVATARIEGVLEQVNWPRGYGWKQGQRYSDQMENDASRNKALMLSTSFVFLLMGLLFESFLMPMAIIVTIPLAMVGVYWTLYLTDTPLDVMGGLGLVVLVGVVVNNGIVLLDRVTTLRSEGHSLEDALVGGGVRRLRPILMTALTTFFGLLPMAMGQSSFVGIPYAPLGRVVGGGLAAATLLTLFGVPWFYALLHDLRAWSSGALGYVGRTTPQEVQPS